MKARWADSVAAQPAKTARTYHSKRPGGTTAVYDVSEVVRISVGTPPAGASHSSYSRASSTAFQLKSTAALVAGVSLAGALNCGASWLPQFCSGEDGQGPPLRLV